MKCNVFVAPSEEENTVVEMCTSDTKNKHSSDILSLKELEDWLDSDSNGFDIDFTSHDLAKASAKSPVYSFIDDVGEKDEDIKLQVTNQ